MKKTLYIVIDVQNDFISGALGSEKAQEVTPKIADFLSKVKDRENTVGIWATRDTHFNDEVNDGSTKYKDTLEGQKLPVEHCIYGTNGWEIDSRVMPFIDEMKIWNKHTFACHHLGKHLAYLMAAIKMDMSHAVDEVVIIGFCTGICVVSNAIYLRGLFPNMKIIVLEDLCACVNEDTHKAALTTMGCCQIDIESSESFLKR